MSSVTGVLLDCPSPMADCSSHRSSCFCSTQPSLEQLSFIAWSTAQRSERLMGWIPFCWLKVLLLGHTSPHGHQHTHTQGEPPTFAVCLQWCRRTTLSSRGEKGGWYDCGYEPPSTESLTCERIQGKHETNSWLEGGGTQRRNNKEMVQYWFSIDTKTSMF